MCSHSLSFGNIAPILTADRLNMNPCVSLSSDPLFLWDLGNLVLESAKLSFLRDPSSEYSDSQLKSPSSFFDVACWI